MRILVTTVGSDGDIQPFLALSRGLLAAGHEVRFAAVNRYEARAAELGVPFVRIGALWDDAVMAERFARIYAVKNPVKQLTTIVHAIKDSLVGMVSEFYPLLSDVDLVVSHPINVAAVAAAKKVGTPYVGGQLVSMMRSRNINPLGSNLGALGNALVWRVSTWMVGRSTDALLNEIVTAAGLAPWTDIMMDACHSRLLDLLAVSPLIVPRDPLWPASCVQTGYWFLDEPAFVPDPELAAFVEREPPIVMSFGSMAGIDARESTKRLLEGVSGLGRRVVIQAGWAGLGEGDLPDNVFRAGFVPHRWLLERAACVVHHGGAGTTGAAFRAGIPQVVIWHLGDQPAWGKIVERLGVGPKTRAARDFDGPWLRKALGPMLGDASMRERARALGERLREEDGVGTAVRAIERALAK